MILVFVSFQKSVLKTIIYFDIIGMPLKKEEIIENLQKEEGVDYTSGIRDRVDYALDWLLSAGIIEEKENFYFLRGRGELVNKRKLKTDISSKNWNKLKKISKIINLTPFVKGVFVSGSLTLNNSNENSDIDLLIIVKRKRIFTARFFLTLFLNLINQRRKPNKIAGKICLNHYLTEDSLEMEFPSLYNAYTYLHLKPIIDRDNIFKEFKNKNSWIKKYLLFRDAREKPPFKIKKKSMLASLLEKSLQGKQGDKLEQKLKKAQKRRSKTNQQNQYGRVILNDELIELHPFSPENGLLRSYTKKVREFLELLDDKDL